jgi:hypothetical protein
MLDRGETPMMRTVIVIVADEGYLPHAKALMVNCVRQGEWKGDFCLVLPSTVDQTYFESRGIHVLVDDEPTYFKKFAVFDNFFLQQEITRWNTPQHKWDVCLYLDCDVLIQAPLEPLLYEWQCGGVLAVREPFDLAHGFTHWATPELLSDPKAMEAYRWLWSNYDPRRKQFNTGIMIYQLHTLPANLRRELQSIQERIALINTHVAKGTDQTVFNLVLHDFFEAVRSRLFCYWYEAGPQTIVIHYNSGYAPWIEKGRDQNAFYNAKLNRVCYDLYLENLAAFESVFPLKEQTCSVLP